MLVLKDISKTFNDTALLNKINLSFNKGEVVGMVGSNGSGKSTLFNIISGELLPDEGFVDTAGEVLGYLPQYPNFENLTVNEFLLSKLENPFYSYMIDITLENTGLSNIDKNQLCSNLSGGQKTRLYLASILLMDPKTTVLLLDEPTNNLDLDGLLWLENFIINFNGIVLLTSHDRFFLDKVTTRILELKNGEITSYGGNYSFYKNQKQTEKEALKRKYVSQQKKIKKMEADIHEHKQKALSGELKYTSRDPYNKKKAAKAARTAIVRQRKLEKLLESEDIVEKPKEIKLYGIDIKSSVPTGKKVLEVKSCSKSFADKKIFENISFEIRGNERLWLTGKNGSGKSTLLKIIAGEIPADSGEVSFGINIKTAYLSQETKLNLSETGINELLSTGADINSCYNKASHLRLKESDLKKKINTLSRGQIAKIELTKILLSDVDLLILDEPTNHLEIEIREDLENALQEFGGAILVASHDRYFVERIGVDRVFSL